MLAVGDYISEVKAGDVVWFHGAQGKSFDENSAGYNDGVGMRVLRMKEIYVVEEEKIDLGPRTKPVTYTSGECEPKTESLQGPENSEKVAA